MKVLSEDIGHAAHSPLRRQVLEIDESERCWIEPLTANASLMLDDAFAGARRSARAIVPFMNPAELGQVTANPEGK